MKTKLCRIVIASSLLTKVFTPCAVWGEEAPTLISEPDGAFSEVADVQPPQGLRQGELIRVFIFGTVGPEGDARDSCRCDITFNAANIFVNETIPFTIDPAARPEETPVCSSVARTPQNSRLLPEAEAVAETMHADLEAQADVYCYQACAARGAAEVTAYVNQVAANNGPAGSGVAWVGPDGQAFRRPVPTRIAISEINLGATRLGITRGGPACQF